MQLNEFSRKEINEIYSKTFDLVLESYIEHMINLKWPLCAVNIDPMSKNRRRPAQSIEYLTDIRNACGAVLTERHEQDALDSILVEMVNGTVNESLSLGLRWTVTEKCAKAFLARKLQPRKYFTHIRKGRVR
jgi:hypothetical protein